MIETDRAGAGAGVRGPVRCPVVVGSEPARDILRQALERAAAGEGGLVSLLGPAGIGKTRLLDGLCAKARDDGMSVLSGRAVDRSTPTAYRPLAEAVLPVLRSEDGPDRIGLAGFRSALSVLLPDGPTGDEPDELALAEGLARLLSGVDAGGCLLVLEDLHWSDPETVEVVEDLAHRLDDRPVLCVASARTNSSRTVERRLRTLGERRVATTVELQPLDDAEVAEMVDQCLGGGPAPPAVSDFVREHADGVPLFVEELLEGLLADGALVHEDGRWRVTGRLTPRVPVTFAQTVGRRLERLDDERAEVLRVAAVVGREFDWSLLPDVLDASRTEVWAALRQAMDLGLLAPHRGDCGFRFRHALARDAIVEQLFPPERAEIARAALDALDEADAHLDVGLVAQLALQAGDAPRAGQALLALARASLQRGALATCGRALRRARNVAGDPDVLLAIEHLEAHAAALGGYVRRAERRAKRALADTAGASPEDSETRRVRLEAVLARTAVAGGRWDEAEEHAERALDAFDQESMPAPLGVRLRALAAQVAMSRGRVSDAVELASSVTEEAPTHPDAVTAHCEALEILGRAVRHRDLDLAEQRFQRALRLAEHHELPLWRARALHELGTVDLHRWSLRRDRLLAARDGAAELGAVRTVALAELHLCATGVGAWDEDRVLEHSRRCVELSREHRLATLAAGLVHLGIAHGLADREAEMRRAVDEALEVASDDPAIAAGVPGKARMALALRRGDLEGACRHLDEAAAALRGEPDLSFPFWGLWALLRTATDRDGERAREQARHLPGQALAVNQGCLALADVVATGRAGQGAAAAQRIEELADRPPLEHRNPWRWIALCAVGEAALDDGWGEGPAWIREATAGFASRDLHEMASRCRSVLRRADLPAPRQGGAVPARLAADGVTSREVDVLRLLTQDLSNPQIAERLHISRRTVERHVSNLLSKTGRGDRHDLAALGRAAMDAPA